MSLRTLFSVVPEPSGARSAGKPVEPSAVEPVEPSAVEPPAVEPSDAVAPSPSARRRSDARTLRWDQARLQRYRRLRWLYFATGGALVGLFLYAAARLRTPFLAMGLSVLPIVVLTDPSCYYFTLWVVAVVLTRARRSLEMVLLGLAGVGQALLVSFSGADARYASLAALYVASALLFVVVLARPPWRVRN